jgi:hypothetical protein
MKTAMESILDRSANPPEAPLHQIASGDFSGMGHPILVAAECSKQLADFVFEEALFCSEVRRLKGHPSDLAIHPPGKVLILLPGWHEDPATSRLVHAWVRKERFTVALNSPVPPAKRRESNTMAALVCCCALFWILLIWLIVR